MFMRTIFLFLFVCVLGNAVLGQKVLDNPGDRDREYLAGLPRLVVPENQRTKSLPVMVDNTLEKCFPEIYSQGVWNCNQAASVWTMFTYEINYLRGLDSKVISNCYSPMAVFNLLNYGQAGQGVSYFDSWEVIRANGIPGHSDFSASEQESHPWMNGYERYYRGMKNRISDVFAIEVGSPEGLQILKQWLYNHIEGSQIGGLANFQIGSGDMVMYPIPMNQGLEQEGAYIMTAFGPGVGHAMTFAGYNDEVKFDFNGDGRFTNDEDINDDGVVDMRDWEIGAMLAVNSWGPWWANQGKVWVMYRLLAEPPAKGGIWENSVVVIRAKKKHFPLLTAKTSITYNYRNRLKIQVGIASDLSATEPEKILDFPFLNFQGGSLPMQGITTPGGDNIELGIDISPIINEFPENGEARIFLEVIQKSPSGTGTGQINGFSIVSYISTNTEFRSEESNVQILPNTTTRLSAVVNITPPKPAITTTSLPEGSVGAYYGTTIQVAGGAPPLAWNNLDNTYQEHPLDETISFTGGTKVLPDPWFAYVTRQLPFEISLFGKSTNQITIHANGGIILGNHYVRYPYAINNWLPIYQNNGFFPFFGSLFYPDDNYGVTWETVDNELIVRWNASLDTLRHRPVTFAAKINPSGECRYYFGDMEVNGSDSWISALSGGDWKTCYFLNHNFTAIQNHAAYLLEPATLPPGLTFSPEGRISGTPLEKGEWTIPLIVTDANGLQAKTNLQLIITGGSSVDNEQINSKIAIYPNPITQSCWIETENTRAGEMIITIYDFSGKNILTKQYALPEGRSRIRLDEMNKLRSGVYFYQTTGVASGSGKLTVIR